MTNKEYLISCLKTNNIVMAWRLILMAKSTCLKCSEDQSKCKFCDHEFFKSWLEEKVDFLNESEKGEVFELAVFIFCVITVLLLLLIVFVTKNFNN